MDSHNVEVSTTHEIRREETIKFPRTNLFIFLTVLAIAVGTGLGIGLSGKMGFRAVVYYLSACLLGVIVGVTLIINTTRRKRRPDVKQNCFPDNLIAACFQRIRTTEQTEKNKTPARSSTGHNISTSATDTNVTYITEAPSVVSTEGMNVLGLVVFSIFFGATISNMGQSGKPLVDIFDALHQAALRMMMIIIWYSPIGIIFLIATKLIEIESLETIFVQLGYYIVTVLVAIVVHAFVGLPLFFYVITKKNPFLFMFNMSQALLTSWVTSSSLATLPITMECLQVKVKADMSVTKFVTPIGATVNIAGAGVYKVIAALFISQINGMSYDVGQLVTISLAGVISSIGSGLPSDILITMSVALTAAGLPVEDIAVVVAVDWLLDRFSTPVNVLASAFGVGIVEHLSKNDLQPLEDRNSNGFTPHMINIKEDDIARDDCDSPIFTTTL